eukprot:gene26178-11906_t
MRHVAWAHALALSLLLFTSVPPSSATSAGDAAAHAELLATATQAANHAAFMAHVAQAAASAGIPLTTEWKKHNNIADPPPASPGTATATIPPKQITVTPSTPITNTPSKSTTMSSVAEAAEAAEALESV